MIQSQDFADRFASQSLTVLAAVNVLFFLSFLFVLALATGRV